MTENQKFIEPGDIGDYAGKLVRYECYPHFDSAVGRVNWNEEERDWVIEAIEPYRRYFIEQGISTYIAIENSVCMWET